MMMMMKVIIGYTKLLIITCNTSLRLVLICNLVIQTLLYSFILLNAALGIALLSITSGGLNMLFITLLIYVLMELTSEGCIIVAFACFKTVQINPTVSSRNTQSLMNRKISIKKVVLISLMSPTCLLWFITCGALMASETSQRV